MLLLMRGALHAWWRLVWRLYLIIAAIAVIAIIGLRVLHAQNSWAPLWALVSCTVLLMAQVELFKRRVFRKPFRVLGGHVEFRVIRDGVTQVHPLEARIGWGFWWAMTWRIVLLESLWLVLVHFGLHGAALDARWLGALTLVLWMLAPLLAMLWLLWAPYGRTRIDLHEAVRREAVTG